jgi:hypothetical protein
MIDFAFFKYPAGVRGCKTPALAFLNQETIHVWHCRNSW